MAFYAYFSPVSRNLERLSNNDSLREKLDRIYVGFNNFIKKEITEAQFTQCIEEQQRAYLGDNDNIVYEDNIFNQSDSSSVDVDTYNVLKQSYKERQSNDIKAIENFFNAGNEEADWLIYLNKLKTINFEDDSIYPLTKGYAKYILSLQNMPRLSLYTLY
tara:strand:+ start:825 stop:1304 length:480 start_codon:yes stop_codon:yes gene_type:complete